MSVEAKRGCGYRKVGGLYLVGSGSSIGCHRLPMNVHVCPVCSAGVKYSRGFTWIKPSDFFGRCECDREENHLCHAVGCAVCSPPDGRHGLMWIGKKFYTPDAFLKEARKLGISKRIAAVPRGFVLGETVIYLAHLEAGEEPDTSEGSELFAVKRVPAVFYCFKPSGVEKIVTETESRDQEAMKRLEKAGITPVVVPDDDRDHTGSVHDPEEEVAETDPPPPSNQLKIE